MRRSSGRRASMKPSASSNSKLKVGTGGVIETISSNCQRLVRRALPSATSGGGGGSLAAAARTSRIASLSTWASLEGTTSSTRSEERRVGKERRWRVWGGQETQDERQRCRRGGA